MRYRRRTRTPEQQAKQDIIDCIQFRVGVLTCGLSDMAKHIFSLKDLKNFQSVINNDLEPTLMVAEQAEEDLFRKRPKTPPGRTPKTRRKDPKPVEAKKRGK